MGDYQLPDMKGLWPIWLLAIVGGWAVLGGICYGVYWLVTNLTWVN